MLQPESVLFSDLVIVTSGQQFTGKEWNKDNFMGYIVYNILENSGGYGLFRLRKCAVGLSDWKNWN